MKRTVTMVCGVLAAVCACPPAGAQLLSDQVTGDRRLCVYVGSVPVGGGEVGPRTAEVAASQPCPSVAPYRDPNQPIPGNAALIRDEPGSTGRRCVYSQGGNEYIRFVPAAQRCAMTPDLLDRALAAGDPGTLGR